MTQKEQVVSLMLRLQNMGCRIWAEDDKLRIRTSKNALTSELKQEIQTNKAEILAFLNAAKARAVMAEEIPTLPADAPKLLSFAQQRLWLLAQLQGPSASYNMPMALQLDGNLNIDALRSSLAYLLNRHASLRMYFPTVAGQPQVVIQNLDEIEVLTVLDWRNVDQQSHSPTVQRLIDAHAQEPFDLNTGPLFKAKLLQLQKQKYVLLINMHHIVSDGWSMGVFVRELRQAYTDFARCQTPNLAPLPIQYSDYANWQRNWLQGEVLENQINYWTNQLQDAPPLLELPTDYPRPAQQSYRGARYTYFLTQELTNAIKTFSQQQGVSLFMTLLAALSILLYRYSRQNDLCIGSPIANRTHSQVEGLIGFFVNTLVLRNQIKPEQSFIEFLQQTRSSCLDAYAYQDIPFEFLIEKLQPERSMSHNPLFQVMFALENNESPDLSLPELEVELLDLTCPFAKFDLTLLVIESDNKLNCFWDYATDLFEKSTVQRMAEQFEVLLREIVDKPQRPISTLSLMTAAELLQIQRWNQTQTDYPHNQTLVDLFEQQVAKTPDNIAVRLESYIGEDRQFWAGKSNELKTLSYQQLNAKANQLAHYLIQNHKIKPDTLIGICVERSLEMIIGLLGILKAGGAYVPLDPTYPQERLAYMLSDSQVSLLLTTEKLAIGLPEQQVNVVYLDTSWSVIAQQSLENPITEATAANLAYVIYTSGSTGKPKGVMIEHKGLVNLAQAQIQTFGLHVRSHVLQFASLSFDASIWEIVMALGSGATLHLGTKNSLLPGTPLIRLLSNYGITHITLPPSALAVLPHEELSALQTIIIAGEACAAEVIKQWSVGRDFFNAYGPTEASVCATIAKCTDGDHKISIGRPIVNTQIYILDSYSQPVSVGVPGELHIGGVGLARGYLNRPDLTDQKFININLFGKVERVYKTGDLARWREDGNIEFLGRIDNQIKLRGFRIELGEIESILLQYPLVKEAIVTLYKTESNYSLVAYVTGITPDFSIQFKKYLKSHLPDYMVPAQIMVLDRLPLTPNGKIDRKALPAPNGGVKDLYEAPRNDVEQQLAQVWSAILERQEIGIHDNFFDLGGHSLLAMKLLSNIQQVFKQQLALSSLFQNPTIAQLAQELGNTEIQQLHPDLLLLQHDGDAPPLFCLSGSNGHGFYFRDLAINLGNKRPVYGLDAPGRDGFRALPHSVAAHASQLIEVLRQQQVQGPYMLAGYSSGCAVAFEIASQLEQQGEKVGLLAILDAALVSHPEYLTDRADMDWIWQLIQRFEALKGVRLGLKYDDLAAQPDDQARWDLAAEYLYRHNVLPEHSTLSLLKTNMKVMKVLTLNYVNYRPNHPISAPLVLFRAQEVHEMILQELQAISDYDLPDWGWQAYSQKPIKVISLPGNHGQILYEPYVKILAKELQVAMVDEAG